MKKLWQIMLVFAMLCSMCVVPVGAEELRELDYAYDTPMELYEDLDSDGSEECINISEEEIGWKHSVFHLSVNDESYECDMGTAWVREIFITDLNVNDSTKEILIIYGRHSYSWFSVLRWENDELKELNIEHLEGHTQDYSTDKGCFPEITINGDGSIYLAGKKMKEDHRYAVYEVDKYQEVERGTLVQFTGEPINISVSVTLNGNQIQFDQQPIIKDDRTLVPMRAIFEAMGCEVYWDEENQEVDVWKDDINIMTLWIDYSEMWTERGYITLDVPPQIINDRTLVPVRAISESTRIKKCSWRI